MTSADTRADAVAAAFVTSCGRPPDGVWSAPGRVNLIGEHTDYNDGLVLPVAIDREAVVAVGVREDGRVTCRSLDLPGTVDVALHEVGPGSASGWTAYVLGVLWALQQLGVAVPGLDVVVQSDVPVGAGLSSSAALEGAVALAVADLTGSSVTRTELALAAQRAENQVVGAPVGVMDQMAALHGAAGGALLLDCRSLDVEHVPLPLQPHGLGLLVVDTRVSHAHAGGEYGARRRACEQAARALGVPALRDADRASVETLEDDEQRRCARHVVTEIERVRGTVDALRDGDPTRTGPLFAASHASMRDDFRISCPELDLAVQTATDAGALAARMTGGGFGGCAVAVVRLERQHAVTDAVHAAFRRAGHRAPDVFPVVASDGAHRLR